MTATTDAASRPGRHDPAGMAVRPADANDRAVAPILSARGVTVTLGRTKALRDVDLDVLPGEVVALVGPNGAGKSTLLAALAGDLDPDRGQVLLDGEPIGRLRVAEVAQTRAVQLQELRLSFAFTAIDVVRMGRAPWHRADHIDADDEVVATAMAATETTRHAERQFPTLSGGEKARVSFARVLAQETAVLLLDEPTAALDIRHQEAVLTTVRDRAAAGVAVVIVLHDLSLAAAYADRIVLIDGGQVRGDGPPRDVLTPDLLEDVYRHPVTVLDDDASGGLVVLPLRRRTSTPAAAPALEVER